MAVRAYPGGSIRDVDGRPDPAMAARIAAALPGGTGWSNLPGRDDTIAKNGFEMPNPLGTLPAVVVAQEWIGSNQAGSTVPPVKPIWHVTRRGASTFRKIFLNVATCWPHT
jgi:hypothetical protein